MSKPHPDPTRLHATVYERTAWKHDIGEHAGSELPYQFCPRCEMEHPLGRFAELAAANERMRMAMTLAIGRLERGDFGAAIMGLKSARGDFDAELGRVEP